MAKELRALRMPEEWDEYLNCLLFIFLVPFFPLLAEWAFTGGLEERSVFMFIAMYALGIGITSESKLYYSVSLIVGLVYCVAYGALCAKSPHGYAFAGWPAKVVIAAMVIWHAGERYNRHVFSREPFFEFSKSNKSAKP